MITVKKVYITESQLPTKFCTSNRITKEGLYGVKVDTARDLVLNVELLSAKPKKTIRAMYETDLRTLLSSNTSSNEEVIIEVGEDSSNEQLIVEVGEETKDEEVLQETVSKSRTSRRKSKKS